MKKCVFAGTFDPPTKGHEKVVLEALQIFDEVVVAVMINSGKTPLFTEDERVTLVKKMFQNEPCVTVKSFHGAACDLLREEQTPFYVRGVRDSIDFAYETRDYYATKKLMPEVIELYIPAGQDSIQISSTLVKNSVRFHKQFSEYLPDSIKEDILAMLEDKNV